MPVWKVLFIVAFGGVCFALAFATFIVPMTMAESGSGWLWFTGLFVVTLIMGTLFRLFLNSADRTLGADYLRR